MSFENRLKERQEHSKPLLDAFFAWAKTLSGIAPKSKLGKAVYYLIGEEHYLRYIFTKVPNLRDDETMDVLLPWNAPDCCRAKTTSKNS